MKKIYILLMFLGALVDGQAQYYTNRNKVWAFANKVGLDFNSGAPVLFITNMNTLEGSASVCDNAGHLLFYTDGRTVYNRLGTIMPGGDSIVSFGTSSTTQASLIVPFIDDTNKYYVFSLEEAYHPAGRLAYSIVDMTLDGGLGDLVPDSEGIILDSGMSEKMFAVAGTNCDLWLITHRKDTAQFYAYNITSSGINVTPVVSNVGSFTGPSCYASGVMKCSHNRQKIVTTSWNYSFPLPVSWGTELHDFNATTGIVSGCQVLAANYWSAYGAEFSPDNSKLYTSTGNIYQWDISLPTTAAIVASKTLVGTGGGSDLRLGPNGKIYTGHYTLSCINSPNSPGTSCNYATYMTSVSPAAFNHGVPNVVWDAQLSIVPDNQSLCVGMTTTLIASSTGGTWSSSDISVATVGSSSGMVTGVTAGTSVITYTDSLACTQTATLIVTVNPTPGPIGEIVLLCQGDSTLLTCTPPGGVWSSSSSNASIGASTGVVTGVATGTATISYSVGSGCFSLVPATVNPLPYPIVGLTTVIEGLNITLIDPTPGGTWSSDNTSVAIVSGAGVVTGVSHGTVTVNYTLPTSCKQSVVINVVKSVAVVGIAKTAKPSLYPNPATNEITIKAERSAFKSFTIYNAMGQEVATYEITSPEMKVNVRAFVPGEYQVVLKGEGVKEVLRFMKW